jgi:hypothetical protein
MYIKFNLVLFLSCLIIIQSNGSDFSGTIRKKVATVKTEMDSHRQRAMDIRSTAEDDTIAEILITQGTEGILKNQILRSMCLVAAEDPAFGESAKRFCEAKLTLDADAPIQKRKDCECFVSQLPFLVSVIGPLSDDTDFTDFLADHDEKSKKLKRERLFSKYSSSCLTLYRVESENLTEIKNLMAQTNEKLRDLCLDFISATLPIRTSEAFVK